MAKMTKTSALGSAVVLAGGSASALLLALTAAPGGATTTLTVDSLADGAAVAADCTTPVADSCSLRDALAAAASGDVITFKSGLTGTITLTDGTIDITNAVTVTGPGSSAVTVDANSAYNVFSIGAFTGDVTISGLKMTGAIASGITTNFDGDFSLIDAEVSGNTGSFGAGVYANNVGNLNLVNSVIANNVSSYASGGVYFGPSLVDVIITNSQITGNSSTLFAGGGAVAQSGDLTVTNSVISDNSAGGSGGLLVANGGLVTISGSTFAGNSATSGGRGGALYFGTVGQDIVINNSTFTDNSTIVSGGAIWKTEGGSLTINQSTITENSAVEGGGIFVDSGDAVSVVLSGSIVSANTLAALPPTALPAAIALGGPDIAIDWVAGDVLSLDHSLVGLVNAGATITDLGGNVRSSTPGLSALADNGGLTQTMALLSTSAAVDAGPSPVATFVGNEFDQRGAGYTRVVGARVDIGAFEIQPPPAPAPTPEPVTPKFTG